MPGNFTSSTQGDLDSIFLSDYRVFDSYVGAGSLWTWGRNQYGQLGTNDRTNRSSPVQTVAAGTNWTSISTGYQNGIKSDGTLWVWGYNNSGELGTNDTTRYSSPVQIFGGGTNWKIHANGGFSSAGFGIKTDGTLWAWGNGGSGVVGDNTTANRSSPVQTSVAGNNWKTVSATGTNVLALKTDGTLWGWGSNAYGNLGLGNITQMNSPTQVGSNTNWSKISMGKTCAGGIKTDGTLWMWGHNNYGTLAQGTSNNNRSSPIQVGTNINWKQIATGSHAASAIKTDGTLWVWGKNDLGQLGTNNTTHYSSPVQTVAGGTNWKHVNCKYDSTAAIKTDGTLWLWGFNLFGQLGTNDTTNRSSPVQTVAAGTNWKTVGVGFSTYALHFYDSENQYPSA